MTYNEIRQELGSDFLAGGWLWIQEELQNDLRTSLLTLDFDISKDVGNIRGELHYKDIKGLDYIERYTPKPNSVFMIPRMMEVAQEVLKIAEQEGSDDVVVFFFEEVHVYVNGERYHSPKISELYTEVRYEVASIIQYYFEEAMSDEEVQFHLREYNYDAMLAGAQSFHTKVGTKYDSLEELEEGFKYFTWSVLEHMLSAACKTYGAGVVGRAWASGGFSQLAKDEDNEIEWSFLEYLTSKVE